MSGTKKRSSAVVLPAPLKADSVASPEVVYGAGMTAIYCSTADGRRCRVTFEKLDSIRVSRGEYNPYADDVVPCAEPYPWVWTVKESPWLRERHAYEAKH